MPQDVKRITGPEQTQPLSSFVKAKTEVCISSEQFQRQDGRSDTDIRPVYLKVGVVTQAKGSAYMEVGDTKVICSVYGPREIPRKQDFSINGVLNCEVKFAPFSCVERRLPQPDAQDKEMSLVMQQALEPIVCLHKFPKARVEVFCIVLESAGSALATAITCAGAALADAGIEMYDLVVGCNLKQSGHRFLLDPTSSEELQDDNTATEQGTITLALMPSKQQISALLQSGKLEHHSLIQAIKALIGGCQKLYPLLRDCLTRSVVKDLNKAENAT